MGWFIGSHTVRNWISQDLIFPSKIVIFSFSFFLSLSLSHFFFFLFFNYFCPILEIFFGYYSFCLFLATSGHLSVFIIFEILAVAVPYFWSTLGQLLTLWPKPPETNLDLAWGCSWVAQRIPFFVLQTTNSQCKYAQSMSISNLYQPGLAKIFLLLFGHSN